MIDALIATGWLMYVTVESHERHGRVAKSVMPLHPGVEHPGHRRAIAPARTQSHRPHRQPLEREGIGKSLGSRECLRIVDKGIGQRLVLAVGLQLGHETKQVFLHKY